MTEQTAARTTRANRTTFMVEIFLVICVLWIIVTLVDIDFSQKRTSYKTRRLEFWQELHKNVAVKAKYANFEMG